MKQYKNRMTLVAAILFEKPFNSFAEEQGD